MTLLVSLGPVCQRQGCEIAYTRTVAMNLGMERHSFVRRPIMDPIMDLEFNQDPIKDAECNQHKDQDRVIMNIVHSLSSNHI